MMELRKSSGGGSSSPSCPLCLLSLVGLLVFCAQVLGTSGQNATVAADKAGRCPESTPVVVEASPGGNCTEECQSDASCPENQKCCPAGCGTSCQVPDEKPGSCPTIIMFGGLRPLGICQDRCKSDANCDGNWKCCKNGCGKNACMKPAF